MRLLSVDTDQAVTQAQLYLSPREARQLIKDLTELLVDPDAGEHFHAFSDDGGCEVSCSLVTPSKLNNLENYSKRERRLLRKNK